MAVLFFDLETELIDRGKLAPPPVAAAWSWNGAPAQIGLIADFVPVFLEALHSDALMVGQNVAFDFGCMGTYDPELIPAMFAKHRADHVQDIQLNEKLLNLAILGETDPGYALDELARRYQLPVPNKDSYWRLNFPALRAVPVEHWPAGAREYLLADADTPARVFACQYKVDAQWKSKTKYPILHLAGEEAYKAFCAHLIACKGLYAHRERSLKLKAALEAALDKTRDELVKAGLIRADGTRDLRAAEAYMEAVCGRLGVRVKRSKKTKRPTLAKDVIEGIPDDLLAAYSVYSQASTYRARVDDLCQGFELPLQVRFNTLLETGRTSTSKPKPPLVGVQAQNFPRKLLVGRENGKPVYSKLGARECLRPSGEDRVFVSGDLPTAELRSVSQQCIDWFGRSYLADAINAGKDVHIVMGATIIGQSYDQLLARYLAEEALAKEQRDQAKPGNFGFWGGMREASYMEFAWKNYKQRFTLEQAIRHRDGWAGAWPEHEPFFERIESMMGSGRPIYWIDDDGERRVMATANLRLSYDGRWRARVPYCAACNSQFQPRTATAAAAGLMEVQRRCFSVPGSALYGSWVVMYTHDEIVLDSPRAQCHDVAIELGQVMRDRFNAYHRDVPIKEIDAVVSEVYSKGMKATKDAAGRLIPWQYKEAA